MLEKLKPVIAKLIKSDIKVHVNNYQINSEPTFLDYQQLLQEARDVQADSVVGIGGGSILDVAKLISAMLNSDQDIIEIVGNGLIKEKGTYLCCIPTTSGTGSEVSPNSILMRNDDGAKVGIISPYLIPDVTYVDPELTLSLPKDLTAYTGFDALTHCLEAYVNKHSHPLVDMYALEGIKNIAGNIEKACHNGQDINARSCLSLGSLYGGMCLGPVNTAAVHALAYPLGSDFKIAHGLSNAILLPYVIEFNLNAATDKYAKFALAIGAEKGSNASQTAQNGLDKLKTMLSGCGIPEKISSLGIPKDSIQNMAKSALKIQRLLTNNVREVTLNDAVEIYELAYN